MSFTGVFPGKKLSSGGEEKTANSIESKHPSELSSAETSKALIIL